MSIRAIGLAFGLLLLPVLACGCVKPEPSPCADDQVACTQPPWLRGQYGSAERGSSLCDPYTDYEGCNGNAYRVPWIRVKEPNGTTYFNAAGATYH